MHAPPSAPRADPSPPSLAPSWAEDEPSSPAPSVVASSEPPPSPFPWPEEFGLLPQASMAAKGMDASKSATADTVSRLAILRLS